MPRTDEADAAVPGLLQPVLQPLSDLLGASAAVGSGDLCHAQHPGDPIGGGGF